MRLVILAAALVFTACASNKPKPTDEPTEMSETEADAHAMGEMSGEAQTSMAAASLEAKSGTTTGGRATFTQQGGKVTLELDVENAPEGTHAVHLHETGDCSAEDASSAGGHWNPTGAAHGRFGENGFHLGDIGNLEVAADGTGKLTFSTEHWSIGGGGDTDIAGKAIIVHTSADDFNTQPTGNAGARIACGVVTAQ